MSHYPDQQEEYNEECSTQRGSKMIKFYEDKADFHNKQMKAAFELNKEKAVAFHKKEYLNYIEMLEHMRSQQLTENKGV